MLVVTYSLFVLYVIVRVYLSYDYHLAVRKHSDLYYRRQEESKDRPISDIVTNNQIDLGKINRSWYENPLTKQISIEEKKCRELYRIDKLLKRIMSIILSILSLIGLWIDFQNKFQLSSLFLAMLPSIVNLFNSTFEWFEIEFDQGFQQIGPKKFKRVKNNEKNVDRN